MEFWDIYNNKREKTGRMHKRGELLAPGDYHLIVHVWVQNSNGEFLITKRSATKEYHPNFWECTGGSVVAGETSFATALQEVKEETGISLDPKNGKMIYTYRRDIHGMPDFCNVWLFRQDFDLSDVVLQEGETCDAKLATAQDIRDMIQSGEFEPDFDYIEMVFADR